MGKSSELAGEALSLGGSALGSLFSSGASLLTSKPYNQTFQIGGDDVVTKKVSGNKITTNYNLSDTEKSLLDYTNNNLLSGLENINVFSDETKQSIQNQLDAYKTLGINTINDTYTPMFRELKSDIASRFGNFDNSIFMDNLNEIEKNRTQALEDLTLEIINKQSELYQTELENRYNYLDQLTSANQNVYSNILNFLQLAGSSGN